MNNIYLLCGEEKFLLRQYKKKILDEQDPTNTSFFEDDVEVKQVIDLAETMPFFADHRCIVITDSGLFKKGGEALADYLPNVPDSTYIVFSEKEIDKRSRLYKQVKKIGCVKEFERQSEDALSQWVTKRAEAEGKQMPVRLFLSRVGNDMTLIDRELEKLFCYTLGKDVITIEDVEDVCTVRISEKIFDMVDAVAAKQKDRAISLYLDLHKEAPMKILYLLIRQFHILLQLKAMEGCTQSIMASRTKIPPFAVRKNLKQAAKFTQKQLCEAVESGVKAEEDIKTGLLSDRLAAEMFLISEASGR